MCVCVMACECACVHGSLAIDGVDLKCKQNGVLTSLVVWTMWGNMWIVLWWIVPCGCGSCSKRRPTFDEGLFMNELCVNGGR